MKNFPSLQEKIRHLYEGYQDNWIENAKDKHFGTKNKPKDELFVSVEDVEQFCLDKTVVRKAVMKQRDHNVRYMLLTELKL